MYYDLSFILSLGHTFKNYIDEQVCYLWIPFQDSKMSISHHILKGCIDVMSGSAIDLKVLCLIF